MRWTVVLGVFGLMAACAEGSDSPSASSADTTVPTPDAGDTSAAPRTVTPLEPPAKGEGFQLKMTYTVPAYTEAWICTVYPLPVDTISPVNWVEYEQNDGLHHMTISTPGFVQGLLEYGTYDCNELYEKAMEDLIMVFGSQGGGGKLQLPEGVAANFVPGLDIVHEVHYVNATAEPVEVASYINAYTIPVNEVEAGIWGGQVRDETIAIPANSEHTEWTRCVMNEDVDVLFLASHTHELGIEFTIRRFDGENSGEIFYRNTDWHDPKIVQYDPPLVLKAGEGFEYSCTWKNDSEQPVQYGLTSTDEMCNLALVHTPQSMTALCEVVETSDGVLWAPDTGEDEDDETP